MPKYKIYFAGALFDIKDLTGNFFLASAINKYSDGLYECLLPQDIILDDISPNNIRNHDFKALMSCDLALFNFDGTELDSGTVAEFMTAKFLSMPAVVLRSDFRKSGDQDQDGQNWNLMCSFYPQTKAVEINSIYEYHKFLKSNKANAVEFLLQDSAEKIIESFDLLLKEESPLNAQNAKEHYQKVIDSLGGQLNHLCDEKFLDDLVLQKFPGNDK